MHWLLNSGDWTLNERLARSIHMRFLDPDVITVPRRPNTGAVVLV